MHNVYWQRTSKQINRRGYIGTEIHSVGKLPEKRMGHEETESKDVGKCSADDTRLRIQTVIQGVGNVNR